jgi:Undecaprenyl-phosphate galactose phosphotransferase WbaP
MGETDLLLNGLPAYGVEAQHVWRSWISPRLRRRVIVTTMLILSDATTAWVAISSTTLLFVNPCFSSMVAVPTQVLTYLLQGLYKGCGPGPCERLRLRVRGIAYFVVLGCLINATLGLANRVLPIVVCVLLLAVLGYYGETLMRIILIRLRLWGGATAIVGSRVRSEQLAKQLFDQPELGLQPVGFVELDRDEGWATPMSVLPRLGTMTDLQRIAGEVDLIIFGSTSAATALAPNLRQRLPVRQMALVDEARNMQSLWIQTRALGESIGVELRHDYHSHYNRWMKRALDLLIALPACILTAPVVAISALAIKLVDPGPAFYVQDRVGFAGTTVPVCKLRTMYRDAERRLEECLANDPVTLTEWRHFFKLTNDPRILPVVGNFIRRTSLDELPQLWNVIMGSMSLVGPRPFPAYHVNSFDEAFRPVRASVQPGLSGLWQVGARSAGDLSIQRAQDLFYILNRSIWLDLYILLETPIAVMTRRGAK